MGVGVVVRDEDNFVEATMAKTIHFITDPTVAEAVAAWQVVQFCGELRFQRAIFEGDSLIVVLALRQDSSCWLGCGQLLDDIKTKLNSYPLHDVQHIRWDANTTAHRMAKVAFLAVFRSSLDRVVSLFYLEYCTC